MELPDHIQLIRGGAVTQGEQLAGEGRGVDRPVRADHSRVLDVGNRQQRVLGTHRRRVEAAQQSQSTWSGVRTATRVLRVHLILRLARYTASRDWRRRSNGGRAW